MEQAGEFVSYFKHEGRRYKLFKRDECKDGNWYVHFKHKKKRFKRSLDTNHARKAEMLARAIISAVKNGAWVALTETKQHQEQFATVGEVLDFYSTNRGEVKERTARENASALVRMLMAVFGKDEDGIRKLSVELLDRSVIRKYKQSVVTDDADEDGIDEDEDEESIQRAKRTANSYLRQGRSVFSQEMLEAYQDHGLKLPMEKVREFKDALGFKGVSKTEYHAPDAELVRKTFEALEDLRDTDQDAYMAVCLACGAGLRKSEIAKARWAWFKVEAGGVILDSKVVGKDCRILGNVTVLEEWWERLRAVKPMDAKPMDALLQGANMQDIFRRVGAWMRALGWKTQKTIHEFRAYVGSKVAEALGIEKAAAFLRHKDQKVTRDHYLRYVEMRKIKIADFGAKAVAI
jgi:integrase